MPFRIIETCIGCAGCVKRCPTDAITGERNGLHQIDPRLCIECGACGMACPVGAILNQFGEEQWLLKKPQRAIAHVYEPNCVGCEKCSERCPFSALEIRHPTGDGSLAGIMQVIEDNCTGCRECEKACPYDAIFVFRKDQTPEWLQAGTHVFPLEKNTQAA